MTGRGREDGGQTTVELALVLPLLALVALGVLQVALVVRDQVLVVHAAREAARVAAVSDDPSDALDAAVRGSPGLDPDRLVVTVVRRDDPGGSVEVRVTYRARTDVALVGPLTSDPELGATAVMRVEG